MMIVYIVVREPDGVWPARVVGVVDMGHLKATQREIETAARDYKRMPKNARLVWEREHVPGLGEMYRLKTRRWRAAEAKPMGWKLEPVEMNILGGLNAMQIGTRRVELG